MSYIGLVPINFFAASERFVFGAIAMLMLPLLCFWISANAFLSKLTCTREPLISRLLTPALTRLSKELRVRVAVKEAVPFGIVTSSSTEIPFAVLP